MPETASPGGTDASDRHPKRTSGGLVVGSFLLKIKHPEEIAASRRELENGLADPLGALEVKDLGEGRCFHCIRVGRNRILGSDPGPFQVIEAEVAGGYHQPTGQRLTVPQPRCMPVKSDEGLLKEILRVFGRNSEGADGGVHEPLIMGDDLPPGGVVTLRRPTEGVGGNMHMRELNAGVAILRRGGFDLPDG